MKAPVRLLAAVIILTTAAGAQQRPSFSGRWVVVSPKDGAGQEQVVTQDEKALTTEITRKGTSRKTIYQLDGKEHRLAPPPSSGGEIVIMATAAWDGDRIVINNRMTYPNGMKTQTKEVWSIDAKAQLVIDYTESGPTGPGPAMKVIHTKKK